MPNKTPGTASKGSDATRVCLVAATAEPCTGDRREAEWKRLTRLLENCRGSCYPGVGCSLVPKSHKPQPQLCLLGMTQAFLSRVLGPSPTLTDSPFLFPSARTYYILEQSEAHFQGMGQPQAALSPS